MIRLIIEKITNGTTIETLKADVKGVPTFIFIMGGSGSGKNYVFDKFLKGIPLIDVDKYTAEYSKEFGTPATKHVGKATSRSKRELLSAFASNKTIAQVGTGSNLESSENKFMWAKEKGMKVVVIFIDTDVNKALKRNKRRHEQGVQGLVPDDKVRATSKKSKSNIKVFKSNSNVDLIIQYKN